MNSLLAYDSRYLQHQAPLAHPECPARLESALQLLQQRGLAQQFEPLAPRPASLGELERAHHPDYVAKLEQRLSGDAGYWDADTFFNAHTWDAVTVSAGAAVDLAEAVLDGRAANGLSLQRPPGHHAESDRAGGFCFICQVAVAAAAARTKGARVAIVDFDVHHGNGTQEIFYADPDVLFVSIHRYGGGFYPGSGHADQTGAGAGTGTTLNLPVASGADWSDYRPRLIEQADRAIRDFQPDLLLVSAGFDAHRDDPLSDTRLNDEDYATIASWLADLATTCDGRWVAVLEGGYDLASLAQGVAALAQTMLTDR